MLARCRQLVERKPPVLRAAFTLIEVLVSIAILAMVMAGIIYGFAQTNRFAEWSSMSLAAQSYALQGLEQVRAGKWDLSSNPPQDDWPVPSSGITNLPPQSDIMDVPVSGAPYYVTNYIMEKTIVNAAAPTVQLREVWSQCVWVFHHPGYADQLYTNTVITYRAPDRP